MAAEQRTSCENKPVLSSSSCRRGPSGEAVSGRRGGGYTTKNQISCDRRTGMLASQAKGVKAPVFLFTHPPPHLAKEKIVPRTDCNLDDEAAGAARHTLREASATRRAQEEARIKADNRANKTRLLAITSKTNDGDGLIGGGSVVSSPGSPGSVTSQSSIWLHDAVSFAQSVANAAQAQQRKEQAAHREKIKNMKSSIDDDTEDDATGEARARLKVESAARKKAEAEARRAENADFFARIRGVTTLTDSKIWDDGEGSAGAMRSVVAAQSKSRKAEEARQLKKENAAHRKSLSNVHAKTDDGDGIQF